MYVLGRDDDGWRAPSASVAAESLYGRITTRDLYKRAYSVGVTDIGRDHLGHLESSLDDVHAVEREIAEVAGVASEYVLVSPPDTPSGTTPDVGILLDGKVYPLSELSALPSTIADSEWRNAYMSVYAPEELREAVSEAAESVLF
jgi:hypothetical protein